MRPIDLPTLSPTPHPAPARQRRGRRKLALATLCLAVRIAQLDTSVVNLALHPVGRYFGAGVSALQWVIDGYNLVYAVLLLTGGLVADLFGRRLVFIAGAVTFALASLVCAAAPDVAVLIAGRVLAGLAAALLLPASLAIVRIVWPDPDERAHALGIWAACNGLAFVIGPTAGGLLIEAFGWRSIFMVVVPLGVAAAGLALATLPESADPQGRHVDLSGQILGAVVLGALALGTIEMEHARFIACTALGVACVAFPAFVLIERTRGPAALVPLGLFGIPRFRASILATAGMTFGMYGLLFMVPLTWQASGALSALGAGLALVPMAFVFALVSPFSGKLSAKLGARVLTSGGVALIGGGLLVLAVPVAHRSIAIAEAGLVLAGLGMGFATGPLFGLAVGAVPAARSGTAAALINVARMAGATFGVAVLGSIFAASGGDAEGLRYAMLLGGLVQLVCAGIAWREQRPTPSCA
jgi:MFS transporter, DHA2 family, methylenomycin A resistance protein